ncbi:MAG: hypothetical protein GY711_30205 [bacterium]|nr:hypothetical protein [bacterium]
MKNATLPVVLATIAACLTLAPRTHDQTYEHAVLRRSSSNSRAYYYCSVSDERHERYRSWRDLLKALMGRRTDTELTRRADEVVVLDYLGADGWELVSFTNRSRGNSGTERFWHLRRDR